MADTAAETKPSSEEIGNAAETKPNNGESANATDATELEQKIIHQVEVQIPSREDLSNFENDYR